MPILERESCIFPDGLLTDEAIELDNPHRRWWAIFTKARNEKALARNLLNFQIPHFLPVVPKRNMVRNRVVYSYIPLFGGYVFMFGDEDERIRSLTTNRVSTMLNVDDQTQLVNDLRQINQLIDSGAPLTVEQRLQAGQLVRITHGSFAGIEGVITQRRGNRQRLLVAVQFLQRGVSVEVDDYMVEPI